MTSIGANIRDALQGQSKADFISKLSISLKEAQETESWLELLQASDLVKNISFKIYLEDNIELIKILTSLIKTTKMN